MKLFFNLIFLLSLTATAQQVPSSMSVAGMEVTLSKRLQEELQKEVDALTASPKYFQIKVDRAKIYFPLIERIFAEENVPDDIKYLVLQESALIPDAVSVSDAVGYWQFKDFTAMEVGLRVDKNIDERMHILSSTRGAAQYLKKNYNYFNNWIYAIQAYQMGAGGAMKVVDKKNYGAKDMALDHNTYWYVKKYIAHKIAFERAVDGNGPLMLDIYDQAGNKTLEQVAKEMSVDYDQLLAYNAWLRKGRIPEDKIYPVILPVASGRMSSPVLPSSTMPTHNPVGEIVPDVKKDEPQAIPDYVLLEEQRKFPVIDKRKSLFSREEVRTYNKIPGIKAGNKQSLMALASAGDVSLSKFIKYNDIDVSHKPVTGEVYYFKKKKAKAGTYYHIVNFNETLWEISQQYGVRIKRLMHKNRLSSEKDIKPGLVLWLRHVRPADVPVEYKKLKQETIPAADPGRLNKPDVTREVVAETEPAISESEHDKETVELNVGADETQNHPTPEEAIKIDTVKETEVEEIIIKEQDVKEILSEDTIRTEAYTIYHNVKPGDTYYSLAKQYDVAVMAIIEWNDLNITDKLSVGQEIKILREKASYADKEVLDLQEFNEGTTHIVQPGETLYQIARKYGVTVESIMNLNDKKDYTLSVGEVLTVTK